MKKARVTKLLAVVAMTTTAAVADPRPVTPSPAPATSMAAAAESALAAVSILRLISLELAKPRTMASGAPACGNVASRAPRPASCEPAAGSDKP